jgi:signal-transduction protein with cAMP-binding, CBS, and nucleotidyltransferase domain
MNESILYRQYLTNLHRYFSRFIELTAEEFGLMEPYFEIRKFDKKVKILDIGETENYFNVILKGLVRKYMLSKKKEVTLQLSTEGHVIHAEVSFNLRCPADCVVETIEPSILFSVSFNNLQQIYEKFPKTERLGRLITTEMFIKKDFRDIAHLRISTRERFVEYVKNHPDMVQRVPQKYLASFLNIKPETFSRLKHLLMPRRSGLLKG